jgi:hypothetical protein
MTQPRNLTVGTVAGLGVASLALLGYLLFVTRRDLVHTGDAQLQRWVSPDAARWIFLGIAAAVVVAFVVAAAVGGDGSPAMVGLAAGGALAVLALVSGAVATNAALLSVPSVVSYLALLAGAVAVGVHTGRPGAGAVAAVWFAVLLALAAGLATVARDTLFASRLVDGAWVGDRTCRGGTGDTLAACEIGDTLGGMAFMWLAFPPVAAGLGWLGGLVGDAAGGAAAAPRPARVRPAVVLCGFLVVVFVVAVTLHLW